jgi:hypothetical protein
MGGRTSNALSERPEARVEGLDTFDGPSGIYMTDDGIVVVVHFVYVLRCSDNTLYIGETADLERRFEQHCDGRACAFTASRRPVTLAYSGRTLPAQAR